MDSDRPTLDVLTDLLRDVLGDEWDDHLEVDASTSFADDLELESIEFVALAERLQEHYGKQVDFVGWLSGLDLDGILALTVGDLVAFVERHRA
jgi:acyl carrier protein